MDCYQFCSLDNSLTNLFTIILSEQLYEHPGRSVGGDL